MSDLAVLRDGGTEYFARSERGCVPLFSAPIVLIQGIYEREPAFARKILRNRILTSATASASIQGMVAVAAKRITAGLGPEHPELKPGPRAIEITASSIPLASEPCLAPETDFMALARALARGVSRQPHRYRSDRPVGAVLASNDGKVLCCAANSNASNRTLHAELNLLRLFHSRSGGLLPKGATIYVTLKPCRMCAGMIHDCAADPASLRVIYGDDDPGPHARRTALDLSGTVIASSSLR